METYDGARYYHSVPGLLVPRKTDKTYEKINEDINSFIDTIPGLIESIEDNFANIDYEKRQRFFNQNMEYLRSLLANIYARGLEADAMRLQRHVESGRMFQVEKLMRAFIMDILSLSVAMQRAQNFESKDKEEEVSEIEFHAKQAKSLSDVSNLIGDDEFERALKMTRELVIHNPKESGFAELLDLLQAKKHNEAMTKIETLRDIHIGAINQIAGVNLSKTILAVDDMPEILSFVNNALKSHYKIIAVTSANAALKVLESQKPDLFILDIDMPIMDGFELAGLIRKKEEYAKTPLIFLTGNSTREHITSAMAIGCNDFIVKPSNHEYLLTKVGKYLS